jgi:hypothetical protein
MKTIVPTFRRVDGDNPDGELARWLASVPDTFTAPQARDAAVAALKESRERIGAVRDKYNGTLPPPPWPARPELVKAVEAMEGARAFFGRIADSGVASTWTKASSKAWTALARAGSELFGELDRLDAASENAPTLAAFLKSVPDPRQMILGFELRKVAIAAAAAYMLAPEVRAFVRRTIGLGGGRRRA